MRYLAVVAALMVASGCRSQSVGTTGADIYAATCSTCHGQDGAGVNEAFPPLKSSAWVAMPDSLLIRLALGGMRGPIVVADRQYNNVMPPHAFLTDSELAAVLSYVRREFAAGDSIRPSSVARERKYFGAGPMWTMTELSSSARPVPPGE
jgi:mono/diheme cytochrome c family protein